VLGGFVFPIGFFARFFIPTAALWWGPAVGGLAALFGSVLPAWTACRVQVAEVFSKVA
jgi:putative ABC transport system permease protein